jgi:DNA polymerase-1
VHAPAELASAAAEAVVAAGAQATRLLFGATPVCFPLGVAIVEDYATAK